MTDVITPIPHFSIISQPSMRCIPVYSTLDRFYPDLWLVKHPHWSTNRPLDFICWISAFSFTQWPNPNFSWLINNFWSLNLIKSIAYYLNMFVYIHNIFIYIYIYSVSKKKTYQICVMNRNVWVFPSQKLWSSKPSFWPIKYLLQIVHEISMKLPWNSHSTPIKIPWISH